MPEARLRIPLLAKFLGLHVLVLVGVVAAVWIAIDQLAAGYFMTLMKKFKLDGPEVDEVNGMFLAANQSALLQVGGVALLIAALICFLTVRRILSPVGELTRGAGRIAVGDYATRVAPQTRDELADLADAFNQMAESLSHMEQLRKSMVVDVAHELRTPLTNLRGHIEALQDGLLAPDPQVLSVLHDELLRLVRLTEDLLTAARQSHKDQLQLRPLRLRPLLEEVLLLFRPRLDRRGLDLQLDLQVEDDEVRGDPDQVKQVFSNLLQNCLQYTPEGGWVKITAVQRQGLLRFVFSNPGEGIDAEDLPWIFEPYYRVDKSRSRDTGGAGIGLAIVQTLVEAQGGRVGASSSEDATRIWVEWPQAG